MSGSTASEVSLGCSSAQCTPSSTVLCSMLASTNQVLGCYVGDYYEKNAASTFEKSICAPVIQGNDQSAVSASYCKVKKKFN